MLRITLSTDPGPIRFAVQGSLTRASADELRKCWLAFPASIQRKHSVTVDLTDLTNIDGFGQKVLREMCRSGVVLTGSGVMTRAVIEEIAKENAAERGAGV